MNNKSLDFQVQLSSLQHEVSELRKGYLMGNQKNTAIFESLRVSIGHASDAAQLSADCALKSVSAVKNAALGASDAASREIFTAAEYAVSCAADAAESAVLASAATAAAASAAAAAVATEAEESLVWASAAAAKANQIAADAAAEAIKISNKASEFVRAARRNFK